MKTLKMKKLLICVCFVDIAKIVSRHDAKVQIFLGRSNICLLFFLSQNPRWHDPLSFDIGEQHAYLNVCVWCHNTEHIDIKPDRPTPPPHRDLLLGQVRCVWKRQKCC